MNNRNLSADETIEQSGLAYVRPSENRYVGQRIGLIHQSSTDLGFCGMRMAFCLQLTHSVCDVNDP